MVLYGSSIMLHSETQPCASPDNTNRRTHTTATSSSCSGDLVSRAQAPAPAPQRCMCPIIGASTQIMPFPYD
jgi:hypothetical protein